MDHDNSIGYIIIFCALGVAAQFRSGGCKFRYNTTMWEYIMCKAPPGKYDDYGTIWKSNSIDFISSGSSSRYRNKDIGSVVTHSIDTITLLGIVRMDDF